MEKEIAAEIESLTQQLVELTAHRNQVMGAIKALTELQKKAAERGRQNTAAETSGVEVGQEAP